MSSRLEFMRPLKGASMYSLATGPRGSGALPLDPRDFIWSEGSLRCVLGFRIGIKLDFDNPKVFCTSNDGSISGETVSSAEEMRS